MGPKSRCQKAFRQFMPGCSACIRPRNTRMAGCAALLDDEEPLAAQGKWATLLVFPLHALWRSCGFFVHFLRQQLPSRKGSVAKQLTRLRLGCPECGDFATWGKLASLPVRRSPQEVWKKRREARVPRGHRLRVAAHGLNDVCARTGVSVGAGRRSHPATASIRQSGQTLGRTSGSAHSRNRDR